ncbi:Pycsar system effector family protein [Streptomyces sp. NPDC047315]|uniref:Pycsar system effector family protein n=1 Tax=Streptomyces sp. NPDC047315 TaxID=3155142 RepID=UPI0033E840E0
MAGESALDRALATAWHVHASVAEVTARGDAKASIALSAELALAAVAVARLGSPPPHETALSKGLLYVGAVLLMLASLFALSAVLPRLAAPVPPGELLYFGALRHWDARELPAALRDADALESLSEQLVTMSRIAWRKHRLVAHSLRVSVLGLLCLGVAALIPVLPN